MKVRARAFVFVFVPAPPTEVGAALMVGGTSDERTGRDGEEEDASEDRINSVDGGDDDADAEDELVRVFGKLFSIVFVVCL